MLDTLCLDQFADKVNQEFQVSWGGRSESLTLVKAEQLPVRGVDPTALGRQPFSLLLTGGTQWSPQGTYALNVPDLGELHLFMVPIGPTQDGIKMQYQIIFN